MQLFFRHPNTPQTARRCPGTIRRLSFPRPLLFRRLPLPRPFPSLRRYAPSVVLPPEP